MQVQVVEPFQLIKFKSSVLAQQCKSIGEQILNYQKYIDPNGCIISNMGGWQSRFPENSIPFFDEWTRYLKDTLTQCYIMYVQEFYEKQYMILYEETGKGQKFDIALWFNINWPGDHNIEHVHLHFTPVRDEFSYIEKSGIIDPELRKSRDFWLPQAFGNFYVTDSDNTFFISKVPFGFAEEKDRTYINLNAGEFIIGHPKINHGASINKKDDPRITIAYNIFPRL